MPTKQLIGNVLRIILIYIILVLFLSSCSRPLEDKQLKEGKDNLEIVLEGVVTPKIEMNILAPISGEISGVNIQNGTNIKKSQKIINYSLVDVQLKIQKIKFKLKQKKRYLNNIKSSMDNTILHNNKERLKNIFYLKTIGAASKLEVENAQNNYIQSMRQQNELDSRISLLASDIELLEYDLKNENNIYKKYTIKSPIDGFVTELNVIKGQMVNINDKLGKIININKVIVKAGLASGLLQYVQKEQEVEIKFLTTPRKIVKSKVTRIVPIIDPKFGRMVVEIELDNKDMVLQPNTKALVTIKVSKEKKILISQNFETRKNKLMVKSDN